MPSTKRNGKQRENTAGTGFGSSKSSPNANSKFEYLVKDLKGKKISKQKLREEVFNILYDNAVENVEEGNYYFFEYDPKFKSVLKEWDQYPLIQVLEIKGNQILGANLHYISPNQRLKSLNNKQMPAATFHYYIPQKADNLFFEVDETDVPLLSQLPLDKFHRNR